MDQKTTHRTVVTLGLAENDKRPIPIREEKAGPCRQETGWNGKTSEGNKKHGDDQIGLYSGRLKRRSRKQGALPNKRKIHLGKCEEEKPTPVDEEREDRTRTIIGKRQKVPDRRFCS